MCRWWRSNCAWRRPGHAGPLLRRDQVTLAHVLQRLGAFMNTTVQVVAGHFQQRQHARLLTQRQVRLPTQSQHQRHAGGQGGSAARVATVAHHPSTRRQVLQRVVEAAIRRGPVGNGKAGTRITRESPRAMASPSIAVTSAMRPAPPGRGGTHHGVDHANPQPLAFAAHQWPQPLKTSDGQGRRADLGHGVGAVKPQVKRLRARAPAPTQ